MHLPKGLTNFMFSEHTHIDFSDNLYQQNHAWKLTERMLDIKKKKQSTSFPISYTLMLVAYLAKIFVASQDSDKCPSVSMKP